MAVLIDTDVLIELERGASLDEFDARVGPGERTISVITVSELLHGVARATGATQLRRRAFVEHLLAGIEAIPITEPVARIHAEVWAALARDGKMIGPHDLWIAATALAHDLGVATRNVEHFARVPGLHVIDAAT